MKINVIDRSNGLQLPGVLEAIETENEFVWLGSVISNNGNCEADVKRRIGMVKCATRRMWKYKIWKDTAATKVRLVQSMIFSIFLYGSETNVYKSQNETKHAFEMWCWRLVLRVPLKAHRANARITI